MWGEGGGCNTAFPLRIMNCGLLNTEKQFVMLSNTMFLGPCATKLQRVNYLQSWCLKIKCSGQSVVVVYVWISVPVCVCMHMHVY